MSPINIAVLWNNKHLRFAFFLMVVLEIGAEWFSASPTIAAHIQATEKIVMFYALAAAASSGPTQNPPADPGNQG